MSTTPNGSSFATKLTGYLQKVDYRVAFTKEDRERIFRQRYASYLNEGAIDPNPTGMFHDPYDDFENCWLFGIYIDDELIGSIRLHVISPESRKGPAYDVFPDIVGPMIDQGMTLIDPTRFAAEVCSTKKYPELPYVVLRAGYMAYEYFNADYALATVRKEHAAFYKRIFNAEYMCEPRPYPLLKSTICLLRGNVKDTREELFRRYPIFDSSFTERRMIFEQPTIQPYRENETFVPSLVSNG
jgi:hypothetical protein